MSKKDEGVTLEDAVRKGRIGLDQAARGIVKGDLRRRRSYDVKLLEGLLGRLEPLSDKRPNPCDNISYTSQVQIVQITEEDERGDRMTYITLMKDGELISIGAEEMELLDEGLAPVWDTMAEAVTFDGHKPPKRHPNKPDPGKGKGKGKGNGEDEEKGKGGGKDKKPKGRRKSSIYVHPAVLQYMKKQRSALSYAYKTGVGANRKPMVAKSVDDLEKIIQDPEVLTKAQEKLREMQTSGDVTDIRIEPIASFLFRNRNQISRRSDTYFKEVKNNPEIRPIAGPIFQMYTPQQILEMFQGEFHKVQEIYSALIEARDRKGGKHPGEKYIICFRELALESLERAQRTGKIKMSDKEFQRVLWACKRESMKWLGCAQAADEIDTDKYVQEEILPSLKGGTDEESEVRDRIFDVIAKVGKVAFDPASEYEAVNLHKIVQGLWMKGHMEKTTKQGTASRTLRGAVTEYTDGVSHLMERYRLYKKLLDKAFTKLAKEGRFQKKQLLLDTQIKCSSFGNELYSALPPSDQREFRHLGDTDQILTSHSYLTRILRLYVGINRERYVKEAEKLRNKEQAQE